MNKQRKDILIQEIKYWKENQLLPSHYCDFLLSLYTEGNRPVETERKEKKNGFSFVWLFLCLLTLPLSLFVLYFTELSIILQTGILLTFVILLFFISFYYSTKINRVIIQSIMLLQIFLTTMFLSEVLFGPSPSIIKGTVVINCLVWIVIGRFSQQKYFMVAGVMGCCIVGVSIFV
ncbi:hypothetical protein Q73_09565 [Bacillus coahuilensis m2-6]|uniref:DUF2157 domain-containing protein n=1 Tax=Bacillus coahuilensis p1.1.43 TaxID=1150625 RepID=A0A147K7N6_9BACI|nr:hypothetical protein [Bacillus coahuilensis]KUP06012.1 hypothetical protein Q75_10150 [Bacillus coahuilensis p1.1.43]KUP07224.1 hypothetical protein Q73_09565 [Bacillus coahuilensis m2-6]